MLIPVWIAGVDGHALMLAVFGAAGAQVLNNIIAAEISGIDYTAKPTKIRSGIVAAIVATLLIVLLIVIVFGARDLMGVQVSKESPGYIISA